MKRSVPVDFWRRVQRGNSDDCWPWQGYRQTQGYGYLMYQGSQWLAHRLAYFLEFGSYQSGLCVLHNCDNPPCCNPRHLFLGTNADNVADRIAKGREPCRKGALNAHAALTEQQVSEIRDLFARKACRTTDIRRRYGLSKTNFWHIVKRHTWQHLP